MTDEALSPAPAEPQAISEAPEAAQEPQEQPKAPEPKAEAPKAAPSRQDALEKAFKTLEERDAPKAEAKTETKPDAKPEKAEAKSDGEQPRGPDGKFAPKEAKPEGAEVKAEKPAEKAPVSDAPSRFSVDARAAWKDAPESVRGEVNRAISELERGIQQKDEQLAPLKPYFDLAKQHGVTVHETLGNYLRMENALRANPAQGLQMLADRLGFDLTTMKPADSDVKDRKIAGLEQTINELRQQVGGVTQSIQQQREASTLQQVEAFASQNPRFDELSGEIAKLLQTGYASDLKTAYEIADRLNPAPQPEPPAPPAPPLQKRPAQSVTGAPNAGSNPVNRQPSANRTEALSRAFQAAGLT